MNLAKFFNHDFKNGDFMLYDKDGVVIYYEYSYGAWCKWAYDKNGNEIYFEDSDGYRIKREYDDDGHEVYCDDFLLKDQNNHIKRK